MTVTVATLGYPRIGARRALKHALERYWAGQCPRSELLAAAAALRATHWQAQRALGADIIPSNDFSLYDHVLDTSAMVGAVPGAFGWTGGMVDLDLYFAMARGSQPAASGAGGCSGGCAHGGRDVAACEMTKWFDTNYHFLVPEFGPGQRFVLAATKPIDEYLEARALGLQTRPVLLGPVSFLKLGRQTGPAVPLAELLDGLLAVYVQVLERLGAAGAEWVQMDEPCLALDLDAADHALLTEAYCRLARAVPAVRLMLTSYFGGLDDNMAAALALPVAGLHLDLVRAPGQLAAVLAQAPRELVLSLGVVDGRNVWRADLDAVLELVAPAVAAGRQIILAPSCSLLHCPMDLDAETGLDEELRGWLAFAAQKVRELATLARALNEGRDAVGEALAQAARAARARRDAPRIHDAAVAARMAAGSATDGRRGSSVAARRGVQAARLGLPAFPTTTIGSFPQTAMVRRMRAEHGSGATSDAEYEGFLREQTARAVAWQESIGLDVLVHGEFERNDMVQYFGERLSGFAFTTHGWVQSYGSRCVRPPILFGDVARPQPMTVAWWRYAQGLTRRPVKGMLTGPVTILNWSFVRDDLPRAQVCRQIALAIRDEVADLERAGARIIQIDEAALREGLPLRRSDWQGYLDWAVGCFRLASSGVADETQIHTHMCYSDFNDIIAAIGGMDADVISIETARSRMELLAAFEAYRYPAGIGPGVYDIHSPRVPAVEEMTALLEAAAARLAGGQIWVNPDCGLKTRQWPETQAALANMVEAARRMRLAMAA